MNQSNNSPLSKFDQTKHNRRCDLFEFHCENYCCVFLSERVSVCGLLLLSAPRGTDATQKRPKVGVIVHCPTGSTAHYMPLNSLAHYKHYYD